MTANGPALAREEWDRAGSERDAAGLVERLRAEPRTLVLALHGDRAPVEASSLRFVAPSDVSPGVAGWAFLGRDPEGRGVLLAAADADGPAPVDADAWAGLRQIGARLSDAEAGLFVEAASLGRWLVDQPHCAFCGHLCELRQAGWSRHCPHCGREHFPRTDPAIIVAVSDPAAERLLLGAGRAWGADRYSTFAGFVEAGESLEAAARREILEEAGVRLEDLRYHASQAWPYPRSLMVGFHATADGDAVADGEEIVAVRWFDRAEIGEALAGRGAVTLPGPASIAHSLITSWFEGRR